MLSVISKILIAVVVLTTLIGLYFLIFAELTLVSVGFLVFSLFMIFMTFFSIEADCLKRESMKYNLFEKL